MLTKSAIDRVPVVSAESSILVLLLRPSVAPSTAAVIIVMSPTHVILVVAVAMRGVRLVLLGRRRRSAARTAGRRTRTHGTWGGNNASRHLYSNEWGGLALL